MKICPDCKARFPDADTFCPEHGVRLVPDLAALAAGALLPDAATRPPPVHESLIGVTLDGRYTIERRLGEGGMGVVFRARHAVIERTVAVKVLKPEVASDPSIVARFLQEAKAASRIGNAHIIDVFDFGKLPDGTAYSVMEFLEGSTLAQALRAVGRMPIPRALDVAGQIARVLDEAHDKGIVHRDLKPENVFLLDRDGRADFVKIVDFGIAKVAPREGHGDPSRLTRMGMVFGTPEYMAPEQAEGATDLDRRADVYSLGVILYEMLVGRVPLRGETPIVTLTMQVYDPVVPPREAAPDAGIGEALERVVLGALAKKREERFASMAALLAALEDAGGRPLDHTAPLALGHRKHAPDLDTTPPPPVALDPERAAATAVVSAADAAPVARARPTPRPSDEGGRGEPAPPAGRRRRWPLLAALGVAATGAVALLAIRPGLLGGGAVAGAPADAAVAALSAPADAVAAPPFDAAAPLDAARAADAASPLDARPVDGAPAAGSRPDAAGGRTPPPPVRSLDVVIRTDPPGGSVLVQGAPPTADGTTVQRPRGTRLTVGCRAPGHEPGAVTITFDGKTRTAVCRMKLHCVPGLKNPYGDCPDEG